VLTDYGKAYIHSHEADYDAQKLYAELFEYINKSTKANLSSSDLLSKIASTRIGDCFVERLYSRLYASLAKPAPSL
jgi:hypothetical protein